MIGDFIKEITELRCENSSLEYKLEKLLKKNQALKKKYENAVADYETTMFEKEQLKSQLHEASLTIQEMTERDILCPSNCDKLEKLLKENEELKKQLENYKKLGFKYLQDKNNNLEKQQKEFITYMNSCIKELEKGSPNKLQNTINLGIIDITKTILQKYKEIIGLNNE